MSSGTGGTTGTGHVSSATRHAHLSSISRATTRDIAAAGIRPGTATALAACIDTFHDDQIRVEPAPVGDTGSLVSLNVQGGITLTAPQGLAPGETWDAHICFTPMLEASQGCKQYDSFGNDIRLDTGGAQGPPAYVNQEPGGGFGTVTVACVRTGSRSWPGVTDEFLSSPIDYRQISPVTLVQGLNPAEPNVEQGDQPFANEYSRLEAAGFEVANVTPEMYRGGTAIMYRLPGGAPVREFQRVFSTASKAPIDTPIYQNLYQAVFMPMPPGTPGEAESIPGSTMTNADDGAYVPGILYDPHRPLERPSPQKMVFQPGERVAGYGFGADMLTHGKILVMDGKSGYGSTTPPGECYAPSFCSLSGLRTGGVYFTGLSPESVLKVTARFKITGAPGNNSPYKVLAQPAPRFDPEYLELYQAIVNTLPPGWLLADNGLGNVFKMIAREARAAAKDIAGPALRIAGAGLAGGPEAAAIEAGAELGAHLARQRVEKKQRAKKPAATRKKKKARRAV